MRCYDQGSSVRVTIDRFEVYAFSRQWPCSGLDDRGLSFTFDKASGDLEDSNDGQNHPHADGGALCALAEDAQNYAATRLGLPSLAR